MCVYGLGYVYVCESYVVLDQCDEPLLVCALCLCVWWCSGGILGVLAFCVSVASCIVMMSGWVLCTCFFSSSILFLMPFMLI